MTTDPETLLAAALTLYSPPFRFERGYIFDANHQMVADEPDGAIARLRGRCRISYMSDAEELQNAVGAIIARALTDYWIKHHRPITTEPVPDASIPS